VPRLGRAGAHAHAVDRLHDPEHARQDLLLGKILLHFLVRERIALLAKLLAHVGHVAGAHDREVELGAREFPQLAHVALGERLRAPREVLEEGERLRRRPRHLAREGHVRVRPIAQQLRHLRAQLEDAGHDRAVVPFGPAELRGTRHVRAIHPFAQPMVVGVLEHRHVAGHLER
jgi:hypothetical protein